MIPESESKWIFTFLNLVQQNIVRSEHNEPCPLTSSFKFTREFISRRYVHTDGLETAPIEFKYIY